MRALHAYSIGSFVRLDSGRVMYVKRFLQEKEIPNVNLVSTKDEPWYEGIGGDGAVFVFPQNTVMHQCAGFDRPVAEIRVEESLKPVRRPQGRPRPAASKKATTSMSITLSWPSSDEVCTERDYEKQADRLVQFIVDELPAGIADKVLHGLVAFDVDDPVLCPFPDEIRPALREWVASGDESREMPRPLL